MFGWRRCVAGWLAFSVASVACAGPQAPGGPPGGPAEAGQPPAQKRITAAVMSDPGVFVRDVGTQGGSPGTDALQSLLSAGLANVDNQGRLRAQLAESVPTLENGQWKLLPGGRMELTWKLRPGTQWHDGAPLTSADALFGSTVWRDRDLAFTFDPVNDVVESIEAPDPRTIVITWRRPFIEADSLLSLYRQMPLPRHLLQQSYLEDKAAFIQHPYWTEEFVGAGPFKLREWVRGSHVLLDANDQYILGRPKIDRIEVRFIPDRSTLLTNVLAGRVELTLGRGLALEDATQVGDQWKDGRAEMVYAGWYGLYPQFLNPTPAVVTDLQFRRALLHATDRQEMADTLMAGAVPVAHTYLSPDEPEYPEIERGLVRYEYDPQRAIRMIEGLGYRKGTDGLFVDAANQRLTLEVRTTADSLPKAVLSVADYWRRIGISAEPLVIPDARLRDREYRANFPSFELVQQPNDAPNLRHLHGSTARVAPDYSGRNRARYVNAEFDGLLDRFYTTIPVQERTVVLGQIMRHISDQLNVMGLFYHVYPTMIGVRLVNIYAGREGSTQAWNAEQWDLK